MSIAWTPGKPDRPARGGAAVGLLEELPASERYAILALRLWCDGPDGREAVARDISRGLAPQLAVQVVNDFADLIHILLQGARRPIMHHGGDCACFGGDEAAFSQMIVAASAGDTEDAMAFALVLMTPAAAWTAVRLAGGIGLAMLTLCRGTHPPTKH